ncbi:molybdenum cofactor synthesis domain-containing protein [Pseudidiomarina sp.]|uniref:molybdenum cofactor synthesis domain-containing protein n=1 Tax=Pseudidiomarina sp. TaxID=2081707 RepID=UPI00299EAE5B|nr:molybdenum cofactor synthesis domain-containing protein [Pseudidiomarina sp.]MDX1705901.1 molybdenum cofactor synthesis domain-containing protein [Pseudidiomarina sp.]
MTAKTKSSRPFQPLSVAVATISDRHTRATDSTGDWLCQQLGSAGHNLSERCILPTNTYSIRAQLSAWIADSTTQVVLLNGGTGFAANNCVPEAISPLFDRPVEGFGELFRQLSLADIGSSAMQSRALAGMANGTLIFAMPGSGGAAALAWNQLIEPQLDSRQGPCNFVAHVKSGANLCCGESTS